MGDLRKLSSRGGTFQPWGQPRARCRLGFSGAIALLVLGSFSASTLAQQDSDMPYVFGVFPHLAIVRLEKIYAPVAADLAAALGRPVTMRTRSSFESFMLELDRGRYDIALIQPFDYIRVRRTQGYIPLVRRGEPLSAVFVVLSDSKTKSLADLKGKTLALPPEVAAVSHLARIALQNVGLDPSKDLKLRYRRTHDSCLQQVLINRVAACATAANPVRYFEANMHVKFRTLATSPEIPHALVVASPRLTVEQRQRVRQRILDWPNTQAGRRIIERGKFKPFVETTDKEYDLVRQYWQRINKW